MTRTRLYCDIDGVINSFSYPHSHWGPMQKGVAETDGYNFTICWAPAMIDALRALDVDLVWVTTWRSDAVRSVAPLIGWGGHGRVLHPYLNSQAENEFPSIDWKRETIILDQANDPSPFLWVDDEIGPLETNTAERLGGRTIACLSSFGIRVQDVANMQSYLDSVSERV